MAVFVARRLAVLFVILLASTFLVYWLVAISGDPLGDLRGEPNPVTRELKIQARTQQLHLDQPIPVRYVGWLGGVGECVIPSKGCDFGQNILGQQVSTLVGQALSSTLRLILFSTLVAAVVGIAVGLVSALRQYTGFDYSLTFSAFLFFSLPSFWVAVLLKRYMAINLNNWLEDPRIGIVSGIVISLVSALVWGSILGGERRRRWLVRGIAFVLTLGLLLYLSAVDWFRRPAFGPGLVAVFSFALAVAVVQIISGIRNRSVLYSALAMALIGSVAQFFITPFLQNPKWATWGTLGLLFLVTIAVGIGVGYLLGGLDRGPACRAAVFAGLLSGMVIATDVLLRAFPSFYRMQRGRVFATIGSQTPNFSGTFWQRLLDNATHLALPTVALILVSFAQYSRYARASMLEVMNVDYVRTARAKGLTERTVVIRHAFRNALIPLVTLASIDFGAVAGGAIITERVFGWQGMGALFIIGLLRVDPNQVMGYYVVQAVVIVIFVMLADIAYAYLDPRIRIS